MKEVRDMLRWHAYLVKLAELSPASMRLPVFAFLSLLLDHVF